MLKTRFEKLKKGRQLLGRRKEAFVFRGDHSNCGGCFRLTYVKRRHEAPLVSGKIVFNDESLRDQPKHLPVGTLLTKQRAKSACLTEY